VPTNDGEGYYKAEDGVYWRVFTLIEGSKTIELLENSSQAEATGQAFGEFQKMLSDLPQPPLFEILPGFHNTAMRIDNFKETVAKDPEGRLAEVQEEVDFLMQFEDEMKSVVRKGADGVLPVRTVHQDTKLSNILFDENDDVLCVIDLDTVMPGYLCYDFGDAIRGGMNTGLEDDENIENISINMGLFKGFAHMVSTKHPALIKDAVMSPGGTTAAGYSALEESSVRDGFIKAIESAFAVTQKS
jgi:Ser/Thr protein kinase RdoA (MazF antagonist)